MPVDPRGEDLKRYIKQDPGGPVVMLNLLKYRPGGEQSYRAYSAALKDYLPGIGAEVLYVGDCSTVLVAPAGWDWDAVLIVPRFLTGTPHHSSAVTRHAPASSRRRSAPAGADLTVHRTDSLPGGLSRFRQLIASRPFRR